MTSTTKSEESFFVRAAHRVSNPRCFSLILREELIKAAVKKNGDPRDMRDKNLLFPPTIVRKVLVRDRVAKVLGCKCSICCSVKGRDLLTDNILIDAVTTEEGDEQRQLFAVLVFMGAGFAARHLCSFHTRGWDVATQEDSIRSALFEPLNLGRVTGMARDFPGPQQVAEIFLALFRQFWRLFASPMMKLGSHATNLSGENLPFVNVGRLSSDKSSFGSLFTFEIHEEFRGAKIPARVVRKELDMNETAVEERRTLEFLVRCAKPNFVQLLFWYEYDNKINFVFPEYPGSLQQVLEGKMEGRIKPPELVKYGAKLKHWLWQGMVDIIQALEFFHSPEQKIHPGKIIAGHFDMKPANILVDGSGTLVITDFGQARIRPLNATGGTALTAQIGDLNYQPPPISLGISQSPSSDPGPKWSRAYDVWSTACIMTEVIEYITQGGSKAYLAFRHRRLNEDSSSAAFWKVGPNGRPQLRESVQETLDRFRDLQDRYLDMVTNLLVIMFSIDPLLRPTMSDCLTIISEDIPADEWPLKEEDEVSICGLGTNPQLRNMHTQFKRRSEPDPQRCKMYLLSSIVTKRIRLALEFKKEVIDGSNQSQVTWVLSDSARREEEEYKPMTLFDSRYRPVLGTQFICAFEIVHPNLTFIFDDPMRGPNEYYHFLTAATHQTTLRPHVYMPISKCTLRHSSIRDRRETFESGHVQVWREVLDDEYERGFTYIPPARRSSEANQPVPMSPKHRQDSTFSHFPRTMTARSGLSNSSGSSGSTTRAANGVKTRRLFIFLPGPPSRCVTINLTNKCYKPHLRQNANRHISPCHVTFTAHQGNFFVGNWTSDKHCPGIPLNPEVLADRENFHVDWVELEFRDSNAMARFENLWTTLFPNEQ